MLYKTKHNRVPQTDRGEVVLTSNRTRAHINCTHRRDSNTRTHTHTDSRYTATGQRVGYNNIRTTDLTYTRQSFACDPLKNLINRWSDVFIAGRVGIRFHHAIVSPTVAVAVVDVRFPRSFASLAGAAPVGRLSSKPPTDAPLAPVAAPLHRRPRRVVVDCVRAGKPHSSTTAQ